LLTQAPTRLCDFVRRAGSGDASAGDLPRALPARQNETPERRSMPPSVASTERPAPYDIQSCRFRNIVCRANNALRSANARVAYLPWAFVETDRGAPVRNQNQKCSQDGRILNTLSSLRRFLKGETPFPRLKYAPVMVASTSLNEFNVSLTPRQFYGPFEEYPGAA
jgi:hypothetical protein